MKNLNNFISEKLHLNKSIKIDDDIDNNIKEIIIDVIYESGGIGNDEYQIKNFEFKEGLGLIIQFDKHITENYLGLICNEIEGKFNDNNIDYITVRFSESKKQVAILLKEN